MGDVFGIWFDFLYEPRHDLLPLIAQYIQCLTRNYALWFKASAVNENAYQCASIVNMQTRPRKIIRILGSLTIGLHNCFPNVCWKLHLPRAKSRKCSKFELVLLSILIKQGSLFDRSPNHRMKYNMCVYFVVSLPYTTTISSVQFSNERSIVITCVLFLWLFLRTGTYISDNLTRCNTFQVFATQLLIPDHHGYRDSFEQNLTIRVFMWC